MSEVASTASGTANTAAAAHAATATCTAPLTVRPNRPIHAFGIGPSFTIVPKALDVGDRRAARVREHQRHCLDALVMTVGQHPALDRLHRLAKLEGERTARRDIVRPGPRRAVAGRDP